MLHGSFECADTPAPASVFGIAVASYNDMRDSSGKSADRVLAEIQACDGGALTLPGEPNILIVDDEGSILTLISSILITNGYVSDRARSLREAYRGISEKVYDIVFLDLGLPDGSGFSLLERLIETSPDTLVIVITGFHDLEKAVKSMRSGAFDYITKPFSVTLFQDRLQSVIDAWKTRTFGEAYQRHLEKLVRERTAELSSTVSEIEHIHDVTVRALGAALDLRDPETEDHCTRVSENSVLLGQRIGIQGEELKKLKWGSYLHDIGKIGIPENLLLKKGPLNEEEMAVVKKHSYLGFSMIKNIYFLREASEVVLYHHEKFDGSGYPYGLAGHDIPLSARIFAVADAFDAMVSPRPYRAPVSFHDVFDELMRCSGSHFDPEVVGSFFKIPVSELRFADS
jgi:putative nucleotidyltransferase with HDIG domain